MPVKRLIVERDVEMVTHDGAILRADVYRPSTSKPLPVLLQRTPYNKSFSSNAFALMAAEAGYAVVVQDTRGRWDSDGENNPFFHDGLDGYDTQQWIGNQEWSNGKIGMGGSSYLGWVQWTSAPYRSEFLTCIAPRVMGCDFFTSLAYPGGALQLNVILLWAMRQGTRTLQNIEYHN